MRNDLLSFDSNHLDSMIDPVCSIFYMLFFCNFLQNRNLAWHLGAPMGATSRLHCKVDATGLRIPCCKAWSQPTAHRWQTTSRHSRQTFVCSKKSPQTQLKMLDWCESPRFRLGIQAFSKSTAALWLRNSGTGQLQQWNYSTTQHRHRSAVRNTSVKPVGQTALVCTDIS